MNVKEQLEAANRRLVICLSCDRLESETGRCGECSCDVWNMTRLVASPCPIGKFGNDWVE